LAKSSTSSFAMRAKPIPVNMDFLTIFNIKPPFFTQ
jgi:hypothetical protein